MISGTEWETLSAHERAEAVTCLVFARMSPEHKIDVVQTLERIGLVMRDGRRRRQRRRSDPGGQRRDRGGRAGSDPARTAADVMLLDGRIEALLDALDEGQQLWRRVQSAVSVLLGGNAGEIGSR